MPEEGAGSDPICGGFRVFVVPGAARNRLKQQPDGSLRATVSAKASGNRANEALLELVAKWAGVPKESVSIIAGFHRRWKTIMITPQEGE